MAALGLLAAGLFPVRHRFSAQGADLSRRLIGDENTARVESYYFRFEDHVNRLKYRIFGGSKNPFGKPSVWVEFMPPPREAIIPYWVGPAELSVSPLRFVPRLEVADPVRLPDSRNLRNNPEPGEGSWSTAGLPRSSPDDILMAKTFVRPDPSRPYAMVGVLHIDARRVRLHITGGTGEPGGFRGVKGPGAIPPEALQTLLVAWNGGFKGPHGGYGMYADGKEYVPLRKGLASLVAYRDGRIRMGEWGRDLSWTDDIEAVRQNAVLLVDNGEISPRVRDGNDTWGYVEVNSAEFITWRSAVGLTRDGHLLVAAGNSLSAETLAKALWAAGAFYAMQLDINSPYVLTGLFSGQPDGTTRADRFIPSMPDSPSRFLKPQERDLMYVTLDESRFSQVAAPAIMP